MKYKSMIPRMILACLLTLAQLPTLLAVRIVLDVSKTEASSIVQNANGAYEMVADPLQTLKGFVSYAWIWGIVLLCLGAAVAIPIVIGLRRGAPSILAAALGGTTFLGQAALSAILAFVCPGLDAFELQALMFVRYDLSALYQLLPDSMQVGKILLISLGFVCIASSLLALLLTITELVLWAKEKSKTTSSKA